MKKFILIFLILIIGVLQAEEDKNFLLRKKIQEAKTRIEELKSQTIESEKRLEEFRVFHSKRVDKRKEDIKKFKSEISTLEAELKNEKFQNNSLKRNISDYEKQFSMLRQKIKSLMSDYKSEIKKDIPYNIEGRDTNLSKIIFDSDIESISSEEIFNRYYNFLNRELLTGLDSEVYTKDNIKYLRIGWIILAYSNDTGKETGLLTYRNNKWQYLTDLDFETRKTIKDSIKMVEGKKAPELTAFPLPLDLVRKETAGGLK